MSAPLFSVADQIVIISGGSRGIGKAIAQGFAVRGAHTVITGREADSLNTTANEITEAVAKDAQTKPEETKELLAEQESINQRLERVKEALRRDANAQDASQKEGRERQRDADDAVAMLENPPRDAEQSLEEAAKAKAPEDSSKRHHATKSDCLGMLHTTGFTVFPATTRSPAPRSAATSSAPPVTVLEHRPRARAATSQSVGCMGGGATPTPSPRPVKIVWSETAQTRRRDHPRHQKMETSRVRRDAVSRPHIRPPSSRASTSR